MSIILYLKNNNKLFKKYSYERSDSPLLLQLKYFSDIPRTSGWTPDVQLRVMDVVFCIIGHLAPNSAKCSDVFLFVTTQIFL